LFAHTYAQHTHTHTHTDTGQVFAETDFKSKLLFLEIDGDNPMPNLSSEVLELLSGVLFVNPTTTLDGSPRLRFGAQHDAIKEIVSSLKEHVTMTHDFATFAMMLGSDINGIRPEEVQRLHNCVWADDLPVICRVCTDPSLKDPRETFAKSGTKVSLSPLNLIQEDAVAKLLRTVDRVIAAHSIHELNSNFMGQQSTDEEGVSSNSVFSLGFNGFNTAFKSVATPRTRAMLASSSMSPEITPKRHHPTPPTSVKSSNDNEVDDTKKGIEVDVMQALYVTEAPKTPASNSKNSGFKKKTSAATTVSMPSSNDDNDDSGSSNTTLGVPSGLDVLKPMYFDTTDVHATPTAEERKRMQHFKNNTSDNMGQSHSLSMVELVSGLMNATSSKTKTRKMVTQPGSNNNKMEDSISFTVKPPVVMSPVTKEADDDDDASTSLFTPKSVRGVCFFLFCNTHTHTHTGTRQ